MARRSPHRPSVAATLSCFLWAPWEIRENKINPSSKPERHPMVRRGPYVRTSGGQKEEHSDKHCRPQAHDVESSGTSCFAKRK